MCYKQANNTGFTDNPLPDKELHGVRTSMWNKAPSMLVSYVSAIFYTIEASVEIMTELFILISTVIHSTGTNDKLCIFNINDSWQNKHFVSIQRKCNKPGKLI